MSRQNTEDFYDSEKILLDTVRMEASHYTFAQTRSMYHTTSEPYHTLDFGSWWCVSVGSSIVTNVPLLWQGVDSGGGCACSEAEGL